MSSNAEYDKFWSMYVSAGPILPVSAHHGQNHQWTEFNDLVDRCAAKGYVVEISVSPELIDEKLISQRRTVRHLRVKDGEKLLASRVLNGDFDLAARGCMQQAAL